MNTVILIPSLNPDEKLVEYVARLSESGFDKIMVVNDGSSAEYDSFFEEAAKDGRCTVLRHEVNKGKGAALKTGMKYYLENYKGCDGIVTGDADGQHSLKDTIRLAERLENEHDALILGCRDFSQGNVPPRSRFGNRTTSVIFKLTHGMWISDTQTGLRAVPDGLVELFSGIAGERYEYEMNMLIECADRRIPVSEEKIETIYIDDNSGSHFHAVRDSFRIYSLIFKSLFRYCVSGTLCYLVDILLFRLMDRHVMPDMAALQGDMSEKLWLAVSTYGSAAVARVSSSVLNFFLNKTMVFDKKGGAGGSMIKYVTLVVCAYFISSTLVALLRTILPIDATIIKVVVDLALLIFFNYPLQRRWVFAKDKENDK